MDKISRTIDDFRKKFDKAYKKYSKKEKKYLIDNDLWDKHYSISTKTHPEYFKIEREWNKEKEKLEAPIIKLAYYKEGQTVYFLKQNTYGSGYVSKKPHLLRDKSGLNIHFFSSEDESISIENPRYVLSFYENVLSRGIIRSINVDKEGGIYYGIKDMTPHTNESGITVDEMDIINVKNFNFLKQQDTI